MEMRRSPPPPATHRAKRKERPAPPPPPRPKKRGQKRFSTPFKTCLETPICRWLPAEEVLVGWFGRQRLPQTARQPAATRQAVRFPGAREALLLRSEDEGTGFAQAVMKLSLVCMVAVTVLCSDLMLTGPQKQGPKASACDFLLLRSRPIWRRGRSGPESRGLFVWGTTSGKPARPARTPNAKDTEEYERLRFQEDSPLVPSLSACGPDVHSRRV